MDSSSCSSLQDIHKYTFTQRLSSPTTSRTIYREHSTWYQNAAPPGTEAPTAPNAATCRRTCCYFSTGEENSSVGCTSPKACVHTPLPALTSLAAWSVQAENRESFSLETDRLLQRSGWSIKPYSTVPQHQELLQQQTIVTTTNYRQCFHWHWHFFFLNIPTN